MVCIYCKHETYVTNSREKSRLPSVWRRRRCKACVAQFSTIEMPDFYLSFVVSNKMSGLSPFSRDKLFVSLYKSLGHRDNALQSASELTPTVIGMLLRKHPATDGKVSAEAIASTALMVLKRFDPLSAYTYKAYHKSSIEA